MNLSDNFDFQPDESFHRDEYVVVHTMLELKMTGNCLKGSRPLLSFDTVC